MDTLRNKCGLLFNTSITRLPEMTRPRPRDAQGWDEHAGSGDQGSNRAS